MVSKEFSVMDHLKVSSVCDMWHLGDKSRLVYKCEDTFVTQKWYWPWRLTRYRLLLNLYSPDEGLSWSGCSRSMAPPQKMLFWGLLTYHITSNCVSYPMHCFPIPLSHETSLKMWPARAIISGSPTSRRILGYNYGASNCRKQPNSNWKTSQV